MPFKIYHGRLIKFSLLWKYFSELVIDKEMFIRFSTDFVKVAPSYLPFKPILPMAASCGDDKKWHNIVEVH